MLVTANLLVLVLLAGAATAYGYVRYELKQVQRITVHNLDPTSDTVVVHGPHGSKHTVKLNTPPFTVLLIGSDSRAEAKHSGLDVGSTSTNGENLSDSIILVRVAPATKQLALLSIPRDLWVNVPGVGMSKINAAFSGGDPSRLIDVIEKQLHIPVNHYAGVGFDSFEQIADAIGGVEQYFPTPAYDPESDLRVNKAGCVLLKGAQALAFVRSRNYYYIEPGQAPALQVYPESDLGRIQRQQAFIKNAIHKIEHSGDLTNPAVLVSIIGSITKNLTVDNTFSDKELISLAEDFAHINPNSIPNLTYPVQNGTADGQDILTGIPSADAAVVAQFEAVGVPHTKPAKAAGKKAKAAGKRATTKAASSTTTTTTTPASTIYGSSQTIQPDSSSFYHGVYIPPGREPGQKVETCGN